MKLLSRAEALKRTRKTTEECCTQFVRNPNPVIKGEVKKNLFKLFSSAMSELALVDDVNINECSNVAKCLYKRVSINDRQRFLDLLDKALTYIEALNNGRSVDFSKGYIYKVQTSRTIDDIAEAIINEMLREKSIILNKNLSNKIEKEKELEKKN